MRQSVNVRTETKISYIIACDRRRVVKALRLFFVSERIRNLDISNRCVNKPVDNPVEKPVNCEEPVEKLLENVWIVHKKRDTY